MGKKKVQLYLCITGILHRIYCKVTILYMSFIYANYASQVLVAEEETGFETIR